MANITAAGNNNIEDINGCHINPEQSRISNAEQGSTYRLTIDSAIWRLLGAKWNQNWPNWVISFLPSICKTISK